ncbi:threonylcarbamoyl-AMP synthase [bacterium]|nr:threonylcarbamoyl-AMP synthase [bacterium]
MHLKIGKDLDLARRLIMDGELVAIPTETVYGLAANAFNEEAVARIFEVKKRPKFDPLIVHCAHLQAAAELAKEWPEPLQQLAEKFWPGPLTLVVEKQDKIPDLVTAGLPTVGLRVPAHPLTLDLLYILDVPLAAPSANPFTYVSPTTPFHVLQQLGDDIPYILDGEACTVGIESTIVRYNGKAIEILRLGGLSTESIAETVDCEVLVKSGENGQNVPGSFKKHYSNSKRIVLFENGELLPRAGKNEAILFFNKPANMPENSRWFYLTENNDTHVAAAQLFGKLRELDQPEIETIYIEKAPATGLGPAINERLGRAAHQ